MLHPRRRLWLTLVFITIFVAALCNAAGDGERDFSDEEKDDSEEDDCGWTCPTDDPDDWKLSNGAIIGIVVAILFVFFGIPILLCFFCAWCCFSKRKKRATGTPTIAVPVVPQDVSQQYPNGSQPQIFVTHSQHPANNESINMSPFPVATAPQTITHSDNVAIIFPPHNGGSVKFDNMAVHGYNTPEMYERPPPYFDVVYNTAEESPLPPK